MEVIDYNDVFLYAKGHYKKTDTLKDLQKILSHVYDSEPEDVEREEVHRVLISLGMEHANNESLFINNLLEAFGIRWYSPCEIKEGEEENARLSKLLEMLRWAKHIVGGEMINNFGKASPKVLPLRVVDVEIEDYLFPAVK